MMNNFFVFVYPIIVSWIVWVFIFERKGLDINLFTFHDVKMIIEKISHSFLNIIRSIVFGIKDDLTYIKRKTWNAGILLWWNRLYLRKDEFHSSLNLDPFAWIVMNKKQRVVYANDLAKRRHRAHLLDIKREDEEVVRANTKLYRK